MSFRSLRKFSKGFSLLEAVVAITIFATSSIALYGWYSASMIGLIRAEERLKGELFLNNLDAYLSAINLQQETSGVYVANGFRADWVATLTEPQKEGRTKAGVIGYHQIGLYDVKIDVYSASSDRRIASQVTRLVGFTPVRLPGSPLVL